MFRKFYSTYVDITDPVTGGYGYGQIRSDTIDSFKIKIYIPPQSNPLYNKLIKNPIRLNEIPFIIKFEDNIGDHSSEEFFKVKTVISWTTMDEYDLRDIIITPSTWNIDHNSLVINVIAAKISNLEFCIAARKDQMLYE
jgi:hypothetical protein